MKSKFSAIYFVISLTPLWYSSAMQPTDSCDKNRKVINKSIYFPNMVYLGISAHSLDNILESVPLCPKLECFTVHGTIGKNEQRLNALSKFLSKNPHLHAIYLEGNQFTKYPQALRYLHCLHTLNLSKNQLKILPKEIGNLKNLEVLNLSKNQLTALPDEIICLRHLHWLYLNDNEFKTFPEIIYGLKNLYRLRIDKNQITTLPYALWKTSGLKEVLMDRYLVPQVPRYSISNEPTDTSVIECLLARKNHLRLNDQQIDLIANGDFMIKKITLEKEKYKWTDQDGWNATLLPTSNVAQVFLKQTTPSLAIINGVAINPGTTLLHIAAAQRDLKVVKWLVNHGAMIDIRHNFGWTPLMFAAELGHLDIVRYLFEKGANINARNKINVTSLLIAYKCKQFDVAKWLIDHDAEINAQENHGGLTPMTFAAAAGRLDVVNLLVRYGADINLPEKKKTDRYLPQ